MNKKLVVLLCVTLFLSSCGGEEKANQEQAVNKTASVSQTANNTDTPININKDKESEKDLIVNPKLNKEDQDRLNKLKNSDTDFYLFNNDDYKKDIENLQAELNNLQNNKVYEINPETDKPYTLEEYKNSRYKMVEFVHPETDEKSQEKAIDVEIFLADLAIKTDTYKAFSSYTDDEGNERTYSVDKAQSLLNAENKKRRTKIANLKAEKLAIENNDFEKYVLISEEELKGKIESAQARLDFYSSYMKEAESIKSVVSTYKGASTNSKSTYKPEEVKYIFNNVLDKDIDINNVKNINTAEANKIISSFESGDLVKLTKQLPTGMNISSDVLYAKISSNDGEEYYIDEKFYTALKHSMNVGWKDFVIYEEGNDKGFQNKIYTFLTGYNPNQSYYHSLANLVLEKGNIDVHKAVFTLKSEEVTKDGLTYNIFTGIPSVDVEKHGMLTNLLKIVTEQEDSPNPMISRAQLRDFLINLF